MSAQLCRADATVDGSLHPGPGLGLQKTGRPFLTALLLLSGAAHVLRCLADYPVDHFHATTTAPGPGPARRINGASLKVRRLARCRLLTCPGVPPARNWTRWHRWFAPDCAAQDSQGRGAHDGCLQKACRRTAVFSGDSGLFRRDYAATTAPDLQTMLGKPWCSTPWCTCVPADLQAHWRRRLICTKQQNLGQVGCLGTF